MKHLPKEDYPYLAAAWNAFQKKLKRETRITKKELDDLYPGYVAGYWAGTFLLNEGITKDDIMRVLTIKA